jgi:hypothetical protein
MFEKTEAARHGARACPARANPGNLMGFLVAFKAVLTPKQAFAPSLTRCEEFA